MALKFLKHPFVCLQCGTGLQAAGGQAAAADEEALPRRQPPPAAAALPPGGLHFHPQAQVQSRVQEACSLETLVPVRTLLPPPLLFRFLLLLWWIYLWTYRCVQPHLFNSKHLGWDFRTGCWLKSKGIYLCWDVIIIPRTTKNTLKKK